MGICSICQKNRAKRNSFLCEACEGGLEEKLRREAFTQLVYKLAEAASESNLGGMGETLEQLLTEARGY